MTNTTRIGLGLGALVLAVGLGAGAYVTAQDQNSSEGQPPRVAPGGEPGQPGSGGPRGFGGRAGRRGGPMGPGPHMDPSAALPLGRLDLTEAQRAQVRTLVETHRAATTAIVDRARTAHEALHAAVTSDTVDEGTIRARSAELAAAEADLAVSRARLQADISKILTPEQRTELEQVRSRRADRMQGMRDRRMQRMPPPQ